MTDWDAPENRREAFQRGYSFTLKYRAESGMPYLMLPALVDHYSAEPAWAAWVDANCQNPVSTQLILSAAPTSAYWKAGVEFWREHYTKLEWDTDRRHQKSKFGVATERYIYGHEGLGLDQGWEMFSESWDDMWTRALSLPYMGRYSAWVMAETAHLMLPDLGLPLPDSLMLEDKRGSQSHRNGVALVAGFEAAHWEAEACHVLGLVDELEELGGSLLEEAKLRNPGNPHVTNYTLESELCAFKKYSRKLPPRFPNWYIDKHYHWIKKAEAKWGHRIDLQWQIREREIPRFLRQEDTPGELELPFEPWWNTEREERA